MSSVQEWTVIEALRWTTGYFSGKDIENPRLQAELLLAKTLGLNRIDLYLQYNRPLTQVERNNYKELIKNRLEGKPLQYITESQPFRHIILDIKKKTFIPRPETELLVEKALEKLGHFKHSGPVLDLGTGSGAIAVALAYENKAVTVVATDISSEAIEQAKENCRKYKLHERVMLIKGDRFSPFKNKESGLFSIIVSNPPYISRQDKDSLPVEVAGYEPEEALFGGEKGIEIIEKIIDECQDYLQPGGFLLLEVGQGQSTEVTKILKDTGFFEQIEITKDLAGIERIVSAKRKS